MALNAFSSPTTMITLSITELALSIYEPSTVTFLNDTEAFSTIDM